MQMINHPNRNNSYWYLSDRGFANEYGVGVATGKEGKDHYRLYGYQRISRERALRELTNRGDEATQMFVIATVDGGMPVDRFELASKIAKGGAL